jgi:hypothetical protein
MIGSVYVHGQGVFGVRPGSQRLLRNLPGEHQAVDIQQLGNDIVTLVAHARRQVPDSSLAAAVERVNPDALLQLTRVVFLESGHTQLFRSLTDTEAVVDAAAERVFDALEAIRLRQEEIRALIAA